MHYVVHMNTGVLRGDVALFMWSNSHRGFDLAGVESGCWDPNMVLFPQQYVLLTADSSFQPNFPCL